jgi:multicomponent Na+:H+ antiporter subunit G
MAVLETLQLILIAAGACFFLVGSIGLLRFPDVYTRIHALTKADNLGLGLIVLGLLPDAGSLASACKLLFIWMLVLTANGCSGYLVARTARRRGVAPWLGPDQKTKGSDDRLV